MALSDNEIASMAVKRGKPDEDAARDQLTFIQSLSTLQNVKLKIKELETVEKLMTEECLLLQDTMGIDPERFKEILSYGERDNGFEEAVVSLLKFKGLRDAIKTKETADNAMVKEHIALGDLTEEEVKPFKKEKSRFYGLPRGKSNK